MKEVVICCIAKFENDYILEWAEYHLKLGFSKIYIYDNNDIDGERIQDAIPLEKFEGKICIKDVRGEKYVQKVVYNQFYNNYNFDWCAFIDIDEFITFNNKSTYTNIVDFLEDRNNFDAIHINWKCYGDNGRINKEKGDVVTRFPKPIKPFDFRFTYDFPENNHIKSIIKQGLDIFWDKDPHTPSGLFNICDEKDNKLLTNSPCKAYSHDILFIRHYYSKSIEEYSFKIIRQCADVDATFYDFSKFYRINKLTYRKLSLQKKIIKKLELKDFRNSFSSCFREYINYNYIKKYPFLNTFYSRFTALKKSI